MTTTPTAHPGPPPAPPADLPPRSDRFFAWCAGLGVVRGDGWAGGVAAGVAARLRIDPLIVRGILVVVALFGFPALFVYAFAWALLPDLDRRIPLQDALRGRFQSDLVGIAVCALLGLLPSPLMLFIGLPTLWSMAAAGGGLSGFAVLGAMGAVFVVAALIFVVARAARRSAPFAPDVLREASAPASAMSARTAGSGPAPTADPPGTDAAGFAASVPLPGDHADAAGDGAGALLASPVAADAALVDGTAPDLATWRAQHSEWKAQEAAWRRDQQDADRAARERARAERQARAASFTADAAARRRLRRQVSPRTPFAYVAVALGLAIVAGAVTVLSGADDDLALARGCFVAALILALSMVLAGAIRRRSGFLAFVTATALVAGALATALPAVASLHLGGYGISNAGGPRASVDEPFRQLWGELSVSLAETGRDGAVHVEKRSGSTWVTVEPGVEVDIDVSAAWQPAVFVDVDGRREPVADGELTSAPLPDGRSRYTGTLAHDSAPITTRERFVLDQESGPVTFVLHTADDRGETR